MVIKSSWWWRGCDGSGCGDDGGGGRGGCNGGCNDVADGGSDGVGDMSLVAVMVVEVLVAMAVV